MLNCCKKNVACLLHKAKAQLDAMDDTGGKVGGGCHTCGQYTQVIVNIGLVK